ncbi:thymidine kinase [Coxiella endosymbiont of Ornithodoros maritimus]|uniref:thymidine kinase n=1 Tax=Coxiella endosymbiont of Ornithodoros maritimus TaxID=1656172 RepID=UPI002264B2C7|nr:thymidine kinase [Coxiella endosymbiont of Ornithodoros maritimus]
MAKLHFYYSAMNAGKSTTLLQSSYNYNERGMDTLVFLPLVDDREGERQITTRIGLSGKAIVFTKDTNLFKYISDKLTENPNIRCVLVDEAQFLTKSQVEALALVTDELNLPVLAYGIRTDFQGEPFEGSVYLLAWADLLIEIKSICHCGRKATMNLRIDDEGNPIREGEQIHLGGNDRYTATCRKHFRLGQPTQTK